MPLKRLSGNTLPNPDHSSYPENGISVDAIQLTQGCYGCAVSSRYVTEGITLSYLVVLGILRLVFIRI